MPTVFSWQKTRPQSVAFDALDRLCVGQRSIAPNDVLTLDEDAPPLRPADLKAALERYRHIQSRSEPIKPQFAALLFDVSAHPIALQHYFPLFRALDAGGRASFFGLVRDLIAHPGLRLKFWDGEQQVSPPPSMLMIPAGHIAEVFFFRRDILERFLAAPRTINIYMNTASYGRAGGVAGGCFDLASESIKLVAHRLYEGFYQATPGVAPFLHEFGHMLDSFDVHSVTLLPGKGFLPGMRVEDGGIFTPEAREGFLRGKRIEWERYEGCRLYRRRDMIPIGHPYVFQNDGEFIAGYLEMFFRNPHYFKEMNPALYSGFATLFRQDPCTLWEQDFGFYVQANRAVYLDGAGSIPPPGITTPH